MIGITHTTTDFGEILMYSDKSGLKNNIPYSDSSCLKFNGIDTFIDSGKDANSQYIYSKVIISEEVQSGALEFIVGNTPANNGFGFRTNPGSNDYFFYVYFETTGLVEITIPEYTSFNEALMVIEGDKMSIYLDGVLFASKTAAGNHIPNTNNVFFGSYDGTDYFKGFNLIEAYGINQQLTSQELTEFIEGYYSNIEDRLEYAIVASASDGVDVHDIKNNTEITIDGVVTWDTQDLIHRNIANGFTLDNGVRIPAQLNDPTLDVNGNTLTNPAIDGHNGAETLMDYTSLGTTIGKVAYNEVIPELNSTYWRKDYLVGGVKTGETLHMVLSADQTGECFNKTVKFYDVEIVTEEDGVTPITEEDGITYIIED